jgi:hypothetical protein
MAFLMRLRVWWTTRRQRRREEYAEKTVGTRPVRSEEGTPTSGGYPGYPER